MGNIISYFFPKPALAIDHVVEVTQDGATAEEDIEEQIGPEDMVG